MMYECLVVAIHHESDCRNVSDLLLDVVKFVGVLAEWIRGQFE